MVIRKKLLSSRNAKILQNELSSHSYAWVVCYRNMLRYEVIFKRTLRQASASYFRSFRFVIVLKIFPKFIRKGARTVVTHSGRFGADVWTAGGVFFKSENLFWTALHSAEILHSVVRGLRLTNKLTTWSKVLERVVVHHLDKKFPKCCGNRRSIIVFTAARFSAVSWARWIQATPSHPVSFRSSLRLFFLYI